VAAGEAVVFAERLYALSGREPFLAADAPALARALHRVCSLPATTHSSAQSSAAVGALAGCCSELGATLAALDYELKRLQWKAPPCMDALPQASANSEALVAALVASAAASASSRVTAAAAAPPSSSASASASEEVWVMDQLDGLLNHSA
jgi:hypothetical protein